MAVDTISTNPATLISQAYRQQAPVQPGEVERVHSPQPPTQEHAERDRISITSATVTKNLDTTRAIEEMHARLNERARGVRETNEALRQVTDRSIRMEQTLQGIIKNYPPFPMESSQRQEILMSYISIRKELERLMVPPPPPPVYEHVKLLWEDIFSENGQILPSAIPRLEQTSSDADIRNAADTLARMTERIATLSTGMTDALVKGT